MFTSVAATVIAAIIILAILVAITVSVIRLARNARFERGRRADFEDSLARKWDAAMAEHGMDREGNLLNDQLSVDDGSDGTQEKL